MCILLDELVYCFGFVDIVLSLEFNFFNFQW